MRKREQKLERKNEIKKSKGLNKEDKRIVSDLKKKKRE